MAAANANTDRASGNIARGQESKYKLPSGLRPLLEAFARETLRSQPADLAQFGQLFFETLIEHKKRNSASSVEALLGDKFNYDIFRSELHQKLKKARQHNGRPSSPMDIAATKIQAAFRGHLVRTQPEKFGLDAELMNGLNQKMRRNSNERLEAADNKKDLKRHSVGGYSHAEQINATPEDRAATKIQSEIRGYLARKHFEQQKKESSEAATKIQAQIRGFLTRKRLEEQGFVLSPPRSRASTRASGDAKAQ
uniref:RIIa domain-containing protein n=1 Tax=Globodera pallida TaxID=36090 RepID=A0A183BT57_GLOPA